MVRVSFSFRFGGERGWREKNRGLVGRWARYDRNMGLDHGGFFFANFDYSALLCFALFTPPLLPSLIPPQHTIHASPTDTQSCFKNVHVQMLLSMRRIGWGCVISFYRSCVISLCMGVVYWCVGNISVFVF